MPVTVAPLPNFRRIYPHEGEVADPPAAQSLRLLWDRVHDLEGRLQQAQTTITTLVSAHNTNEANITAAQRAADEALAIAQQPGGTPAGPPTTAPVPPGPPAGDPGSQTNPIIAMSSNPADIATSVRNSLQFYGIGFNPSVDNYWIDKASTIAQFSNGKWYLGWNAYWDARANPLNNGSADPNLGDLPSPNG